jgi:hypothetical protein
MDELVRVSSFGKKDTPLSIDPDFIRFGEKKIRKAEITEILYSISAIQFYKFSLGTRYHIGLKTLTDQADIILNSYFGMENNYFQDLFSSIMEEIWEPVTDSIWDTSKNLLAAGGALQVGSCQVSKAGILITRDHAFTRKQQLIRWEDLHYEKKHDRLVLNSKSDQQVWTHLYFRDTWNIDILMTLLDWLTQEGGLAEIRR